MRRWLSVIFLSLTVGYLASAQNLTVTLSPTSGQTGTTVTISIAGGNPNVSLSCYANGAFISTRPYGEAHTYVVPASAIPGSTIVIACQQSTLSAVLEGKTDFLVTAPPPPQDSDGDGLPDHLDQCPSQFAQTSDGCPIQPIDPPPALPTLVPQPEPQLQPTPVPQSTPLPTTGPCRAFAVNGAVNIRAERSTEAAIIGRIALGAGEEVGFELEGWYFLPASGGWVRADVVRLGGDCSQITAIPLMGDTPSTFSREALDSLRTVWPTINLGALCLPNLQARAAMEFNMGLSEFVPGFTARRVYDEQWAALNNPANRSRLEAQYAIADIGLTFAAALQAIDCAYQQGDMFAAAYLIGPSNLAARNVLWISQCVPLHGRLTPADRYAWRYIEQALFGLAEVASFLGDPNQLLELRRIVFCTALTNGQAVSPADLTVLRWVHQCGALTLTELQRVLERAGSADERIVFNVYGDLSLVTLDTLRAYYRRHAFTRCPSNPRETLLALARTTATSAPVAPPDIAAEAPEGTVFALKVYAVECAAAGATFDTPPRSSDVPHGCAVRGPVDGRYSIEPNFTYDSFERGIEGIRVNLLYGPCHRFEDRLDDTMHNLYITDGNGMVYIPFSAARMCVTIDANHQNNRPFVLANGTWWLPSRQFTRRIALDVASRGVSDTSALVVGWLQAPYDPATWSPPSDAEIESERNARARALVQAGVTRPFTVRVSSMRGARIDLYRAGRGNTTCELDNAYYITHTYTNSAGDAQLIFTHAGHPDDHSAPSYEDQIYCVYFFPYDPDNFPLWYREGVSVSVPERLYVPLFYRRFDDQLIRHGDHPGVTRFGLLEIRVTPSRR